MSEPEITAVIVAWNSADSLESCIRALRGSSGAAGAPIEIIAVDNGSSDESARVAREAGADAVVQNPFNAGFVVAASQGIALARSPWILLVNPDLLVSEGFVAAILRAAGSAPQDVAALVPDVRFAFDPSIVNSRGIEVDEVGIPAERDGGRVATELEAAVEVFGVTSSACVLRADALHAVGGLEPGYFAYMEDVDLDWRLRKKGYRAVLVPGAVGVHEGSASTREGSWLKAFLVARNRRILFRLHGPHSARARFLRGITELGHATVQALSGSGTASIRGRISALRMRRYMTFLKASNRSIGIPDKANVPLAPRVKLLETLRRKQVASNLMQAPVFPSLRSPRPTRSLRRPGRTSREPPLTPEGQRPLRVLVDAANLKPGQGGIRTYTLGLIRSLADERRLDLSVATSVAEVAERGDIDVIPLPPRTRTAVGRALWRERQLAALARARHIDVVLTPVPELPLRRLPVPSVVVVHDVGPLVAPAFYSRRKRLRYATVLRHACDVASAVVCVSQTTLLGLQASTGIDPRRCEVIGEGPQLLHDSPSPPAGRTPYVLYVGSMDPRKNVDTLLSAVVGADPPLGVELVIVGPVSSEESSVVSERVSRLGTGDRVHHRGFVEVEKLSGLYRSASAVALPSLYEGFGLPVLEAMQAGVPVVASDIPAVREVAGDAALYVSRPLDPVCWREALIRITSDEELRTELVRRGREAAAQFSWPEVARTFCDLLLRITYPGTQPGARTRPAGDERFAEAAGSSR